MIDDRNKLLKLNTYFGVLNQLVSVICGLVLPRLILLTYGSSVNGLVNSITELLGIISLLEMGMGTVVQSTLYKPLANNDKYSLNVIYYTANRFFRNLGKVFSAYVLCLMLFVPYVFISEFDLIFIIILIFAISISMFAQYYFGIVNGLYLQAAQLSYHLFFIQIITTLLNTSLCYYEIFNGYSILTVKLTTSIVYALRPLYLYLQVWIKYDYLKVQINENSENVLPDRWNGFIQHISAFVLQNTDIIILTFFSSLKNVSIYSVYYLISKSMVQFIVAYMSGYQSFMGNLLAKNDLMGCIRFFRNRECVIHFMSSCVFSITAFLIVPFVKIYTAGVTDTNYSQPIFAYLLVFSQWIWSLRMFYYIPVKSIGHYKATQWSAIIEALLNILLSILFVNLYGLSGVAVGTIVSIMYRCVNLILYDTVNIFNIKFKYILKLLLFDIIIFITIAAIFFIVNVYVGNYFDWSVLGFKLTLISVPITFVLFKIYNITTEKL